jgi:hypothetical protein
MRSVASIPPPAAGSKSRIGGIRRLFDGADTHAASHDPRDMLGTPAKAFVPTIGRGFSGQPSSRKFSAPENVYMVARVSSARFLLGSLSCGAALLALAGCSNPNIQPSNTTVYNSKWETANQPPSQTVFGSGNPLQNLFGGGSSKAAVAAANGVGVNTYLWRASLDTISFMPLASADPFGGVIITDWYSPPETPNERFKINVFILDKDLHAAGLKATVFRQTRAGDAWTDAAVDDKTAQNLEDSILTRARQLRVATAEIDKQKQ